MTRSFSYVTLLLFFGVAIRTFAAGNVNIPASVTVVVVPNAPSGLAANTSSPNQINLSWADNSNNETGFSIERSVGSDKNFSVIATTPANVAVYADVNLSPTTLYFYRVDAFNAEGVSIYGNEASITTPSAPLPPPPSGGGGGGGGGGYSSPPIFQTSAIFRGIAYPSSKVTLLENGQVVAVTQSGPDAKFEVDLSDGTPGTYNFGVWAMDPAGNRSTIQTFQIFLTTGATTIISGIFFPPTISADKISVKQGDLLTLLGYTTPQATVTVVVHSNNTFTDNVTSSDEGTWLYKLPTDNLALGAHTANARAAAGGDITTDSASVNFTVGSENVSAPQAQTCVLIGDLNGDCRVDLIDFSIMAYWYERENPPALVDLNHDGKIDLIDFSILAYYWTG